MQLFLHSWQFFIVISVITLSFATILQRILLKNNKTDGVTYSIFFQLLAGIVITIFALIHGFKMPNLLAYLPNVIAMVFLYGFANVCIFKSLSLIEASEFTVLFTTRALWTILGSVVFLGEHFSYVQIVGTALVLGGVIVVSITKKKFKTNKGLFFALIAGLFFGLAFTNDAYLVRHFDVLSYESIAFLLPTVGMLLVYPKTVTKLKELVLPGVFWKLLIFSTLWGTAAVTVFQAYQIGRNAAQLSVLAQTSTILTVVLSILILKETSNLWKKVLGSILAFIGVILIG